MVPARFLALIFLGAAGLSAHAAVGDELPTLRAAYGSAKQVGDQMVFLHDGFSIAVYFDGSHSAMEIFTLADQPAPTSAPSWSTDGRQVPRGGSGEPQTRTDFTQKDIDAILAQESGEPWREIQTRSGQPTWLSGDGQLIARFNPTEKILAILVNEK